MKKTFLTIGCVGMVSLPLPILPAAVAHSQTQARCPANQSGCTLENAPQRIRQRVNEGAADVWNNPNSNGRVNEVRRTLRDCMNCGMDALQDGIDRITAPNSSSQPSSSNPSSTSSSSRATPQ